MMMKKDNKKDRGRMRTKLLVRVLKEGKRKTKSEVGAKEEE
jgi:hypothetical protein